MRLAVGTNAGLLDVQLDDGFGVTRETIVGHGHHYGIALLPDEDNLLLCKHNHGMDRYVASGAAPLRRIGRIEQVSGGISSIHQIAYAHGGVYLADTRRNRLVFQGSDGRQETLHLNDHEDDVDHLNSVFPCGAGVLVMLHNWYRRPSEIVLVEHRPGGTLRPAATIRLPDRGCHNVFVDDRRLLYNASETGRVVAVDLALGTVERIAALPGHVKGLSVTADHVVVGCSPHVKGRLARSTSRGGLVVLDRHSLAVVTTVELGQEGPVGNVNEIRALDGQEAAHAGRSWPPDGLRSFRVPGRSGALAALRIRARIRRRRR
jgi:hypothetical protein